MIAGAAPNNVPVVIVAALGRNGVIGVGNALPWHLKSDLQHFKAMTMGCPVIMGRKTYHSIGRPLAGRHLIVVTRAPDAFSPPDGAAVEASASLASALRRGDELARRMHAPRLVVAGGAEIYALALAHADVLALTEVDLEPVGDVFFPTFDRHVWIEASRVHHAPKSGDDAAYALVTYHRARSKALGA